MTVYNCKSEIEYQITGGKPVVGEISCMGAKNLATKVMVASLLAFGKTTIYNVPHIGDVEITERMLHSMGVTTKWVDTNIVEIDSSTLNKASTNFPDSRTNRVPILLLSILLHKFNTVLVPVVGGDGIGRRKVDFHITAIENFGAQITLEGSCYCARTCDRLQACHITLPYPSVGATETCLFLGVLANGTSVIDNIAMEPEIGELITMLRSMGAIIFLSSDRRMIIKGVEKLHCTSMHLIGDRIEAASWAALACASNGRIKVFGVTPFLLGNFLSHYVMVGGGFHILGDNVIEFYRAKTKLTPTIVETDVYPGFSTDWQQPFAALLTQADGFSVIHETVYEQRFGYLDILNKLGAKTQTVKECLGSLQCRYKGYDHPHSALIKGVTQLKAINEPILVPDIRAGLAYVIAATLAEGTSILHAVEQIERGYGNLQKKLQNTNLEIKRIVQTDDGHQSLQDSGLS